MMSRRKEPYQVVIDTFGGVRPASRALDIDPKQIYHWKKNGVIHPHKIRQIIAAARKIGIDIEAESLLPV